MTTDTLEDLDVCMVGGMTCMASDPDAFGQKHRCCRLDLPYYGGSRKSDLCPVPADSCCTETSTGGYRQLWSTTRSWSAGRLRSG